jgi:hypothetical protein
MPIPFDNLQDSYMGVISPIVKERQNTKLGHNINHVKDEIRTGDLCAQMAQTVLNPSMPNSVQCADIKFFTRHRCRRTVRSSVH